MKCCPAETLLFPPHELTDFEPLVWTSILRRGHYVDFFEIQPEMLGTYTRFYPINGTMIHKFMSDWK